MVHLEAAYKTVIPVSPATEGYNTERLAVERYEFPAPKPAQTKTAFLWTHSNGFHKETLHPLMHRFIRQLRQLSQYDHTDIHFVSFDARNHGDSALLNEGKHIPYFSWFDQSFDTRQVIKEMRLKEDYDTLIGVGHSFGATSMINLEFFYPKTFDGLCMLEPVIRDEVLDVEIRNEFPPIKFTDKRRDTWDSREACFKALAPRPFWRDLHPEVLENYVKFALYDTPDGKVKLKCPKEEERDVYKVGFVPSINAFASLRAVSIPVRFVLAHGSVFTDPTIGGLLREQSPRVSVDMVDGTHMVPGEKPDDIVPSIVALTNDVNTEKNRKAAKL
ncbi:Alpha/Beta hydrolase protein [Syncephalastrum racemosum]|uniref:Alpha/Beta hydrolase protein n=1 Tax=Syncephalastrum racemosum TaxID=13706 RepID=A0A1X2HPD4_SYNRA|nr:Alpha/Beta hydrolase protein [Syncephalastrum racemosum]